MFKSGSIGTRFRTIDPRVPVTAVVAALVLSGAAMGFGAWISALLQAIALASALWALAAIAHRRKSSPPRGSVDNLPGTVYRYVRRADRTGYFAYISEGCWTMFGVRPGDALEDPESILGLFHPEDREELRTIMDSAAELCGEDWWCGRVTVNGQTKWLTITARGHALPSGETCWDGIVLDDTRRQNELVESKRFLDSVIENLPDMVFIKDAEDLKFVYLNRAGEDLLGFSRNDLIGKSDCDFFPLEQAKHFVDRDRAVLRGNEVVSYPSEPVTTRFRGTRLLHTKKIPIADSNGKPLYLLGISEDVTDRMHTEEALLESQHRLNAILNYTTTPIFLQDDEGRVVLFNESALNMTGVGVDQMLGRIPEEFMSPCAARAYRQAELEVRATGRAVELEEVVDRADGQRTYLTIRFPILDAQGQVYAVGTVATDITERKRIMDEARLAKEEAEGANMAKSLFLSRMSHELRTPLNAILGFAQLLEFEDLPREQTDAVKFILSSGRHLLRLINEVLDISRIESGNFSVSVEPVQVQEVVQDAVVMIRPMAEVRGVKLRVGEIDPELYFHADRQRVSQALINLLSNAVKYNREGGCVEVTYHGDESGLGRVHVLDTGPGIPAQHVGRLFTPFDRLGAEASSVEGTGLGLSLSRRLVEAMGGEMGLIRSDSEGSEFFVQLPLTGQPAGMKEAETGGQASWRRSA